MKISCLWLQDFVDIDLFDVDQLSDALAMIGLPVEGIEGEGEECVLELEVTANRPDCLNHLGVAREIAAQFSLKLRPPDFSEPPGAKGSQSLEAAVAIQNPELCPRYTARVITNVTMGESPAWMQRRLEALGQRPINSMVDITNYVLFEMGQPLHAFDYDKLAENRIVVRAPGEEEALTTLDGVDRELDSSMVVICDAVKPVALGGVMGGSNSEISEGTQTILLESAYFAPASIRRTAKQLGMRTEASYRFERGADPEAPRTALNRACRLIEEITGGACIGPVIDENPNPVTRRKIQLRAERISQVLGISIDPSFVAGVLGRLEFEVEEQENHSWQIGAPGFRGDVELEEDLVEEVARHHGYDQIASTYPAPQMSGTFRPTQQKEQLLSSTLEGFGFFEAINYAFTSPEREARFWGENPPLLPIANPLTEEDSHLRSSLVSGLVESIQRNLNQGNPDVRLYEVGRVFLPDASGNPEEAKEEGRLGLAATGDFYRPFWGTSEEEFNFYHLKGVIERLLEIFGPRVEFRKTSAFPCLHPGYAAEFFLGDKVVGFLGRIHPRLQEHYKFRQNVFLAELTSDLLDAASLGDPTYVELKKLPSIEQDLSFLIDKNQDYGKLVDVVQALDLPQLRRIQLIDLYQGPKVPKEKVSLTLRLVFADAERTLTLPEVNQQSQLVFSVLQRDFGAEGR